MVGLLVSMISPAMKTSSRIENTYFYYCKLEGIQRKIGGEEKRKR
jgi:hypothetical protein